jgi:hypothetical protein
MIEHARDSVVDRTTEPLALGSDVDEGDGRSGGAGMLVHRTVNSYCGFSGRKVGGRKVGGRS